MSDDSKRPTSGNEFIDIMPTSNSSIALWSPVIGSETISLTNNLGISPESQATLRNEAAAVLRRCIPPTAPKGDTTGIIMGYVQSGKTMSFTTVTTLARDNNFPIVIVIAGTSIPLFNQSEARLKADLRLNQRDDRNWKHISNPTLSDRQAVENVLAEWSDSTISSEGRQTVLITVMKHHTHLRNLNKLLKELNLNQIPVLIIDDEADQAGLNTSVKKGEQSTTYAQIVELRDRLPHHSFLQYTATPQAPLLINLIDILSPKFALVLTPGESYTGGKIFFSKGSLYADVIPDEDIPTKDKPLYGAPASLRKAIALFYLGVADAYVKSESPKGNRSMLIHPSQKTVPHTEYTKWVNAVREVWINTIEAGSSRSSYQEVREEFYEAYKDLSKTVKDLSEFDDIMAKLQRAINKTIIKEVNSKQKDGTPLINWKNDYAYILIGGQAMDRGFTIEGLTITYMPRSAGLGNADTVQQRARFFGYKLAYLGYCRVFIEKAALYAFRVYVEHEEDIRRRLKEYSESMKPLTDWKRAFFLDTKLRPTRANVLDLPYLRDNFSNEWYFPKAPHAAPKEAIDENRKIVQQFTLGVPFDNDEGDPRRTMAQRHKISTNVSLSDVFQNLLLQLRVTSTVDSPRFTGVLLQIKQYLDDNPTATCTIYDMSRERGERTAGANGEIAQIPQGANQSTGYPGDRELRKQNELTIQIHHLKVVAEEVFEDVPAIAIWVPDSMSKPWLIQ